MGVVSPLLLSTTLIFLVNSWLCLAVELLGTALVIVSSDFGGGRGGLVFVGASSLLIRFNVGVDVLSPADTKDWPCFTEASWA